jgi:hypothetical protein
MDITADILPALADRDTFVARYSEYVCDTLQEARLFPKFSPQRLVEAHGAWQNDLTRVGDNEPHLDEGLDHFKQCGHLVFWLRRTSPLIDVVDLTQNVADASGLPLIPQEQAFRDLLFGYANEYLAFDFGYQICKFYELGKAGGSARASTVVPDVDYYKTMCHFLKYKSVSPHAIFLIYKSVFI